MCGLRSEIETRSLLQLLRDMFRRDPSRRDAAEVVPLPETAWARQTQPAGAEEKSRSEAA